jgi:hypothetical protein
MIAKELGVDFGYNYSRVSGFQSACRCDAGLCWIALPAFERRIESRAGAIFGYDEKRFSERIDSLRRQVEAINDTSEKIIETPKVGHKLHRLTTMTEKTAQFHLLAHGNPKPENLLVSPLVQFNLDGTPRVEEQAEAAAVGVLKGNRTKLFLRKLSKDKLWKLS